MQEQESTATVGTEPANGHIRAAVERLAEARRKSFMTATALAAVRRQFELEQAPTIEAALRDHVAEEQADSELRALALAHFATTGDLTPAPGVEITLRTAFDVDPDGALAYAKRTGQGLIAESFDLKVLQKIAKVAPVEGIVLREVPTVRVASDLDKALAGGGV
jgi:hypothetical protein